LIPVVEEQLLFKVVNLSTPWRMREEYMKYINLSSFLTYLLAWLVSKKSISISSHLCLPCFCFVFGLSCLTFVLAVLMGSRYHSSTRCLFFFLPLAQVMTLMSSFETFPPFEISFFLKNLINSLLFIGICDICEMCFSIFFFFVLRTQLCSDSVSIDD